MTDNNGLLTKNEAQHWLETRELPENFSERVEAFIATYACPNCDGVGDMNFVLRNWDAPAPSPCPFCQ